MAAGRVRLAIGWVLAVVVVQAGCAPISIWEVRSRPAANALRQLVERDVPADVPERVTDSPQIQAAREFDRAAERTGWGSLDEAARLEFRALAHASVPITAFARGGEETREWVEARRVYNRALGRFLLATGGHVIRPDKGWRAGLAGQGVRVVVDPVEAVRDPERFDEIRFTADFVTRGFGLDVRTEGVGVPMFGIRKRTAAEVAGRTGEERFYPFFEVAPFTAFLRFTGPDSAVLEFRDTLRVDQVVVEGRPLALATDLTTPTGYHFAKGGLQKLEKVGLLTPQKTEQESGLHLLHPYERGKVPVVMVHGLGSSPLAWAKVVNDLRGDPRLRARYQFWMFMYPTGNPFLLSAADLRKALVEVRRAVDPGANDPALDETVLIGHSMGGLLARLAVTESGDGLWKVISGKPFETMAGDPEAIATMKRIMFTHPVPTVRRVVFIATPHRGSRLGNQLIGRLVDRLIKLPSELNTIHDGLVAKNPPDFFIDRLGEGIPSSIDELEVGNPILKAIDALPISPRVVAHSIIGRIGFKPLKESSDGVVPYRSSHLDWTASECVIEATHFCQDDPKTIAELRRILMLGLDDAAPR